MAVAAAAVKPSPPARVVVVVVLVLVRFVLALMLAFGRVAARAVPYLGFATSWLFSAGLAATIVARRLCSECSASLVLLEARLSVAASKACVGITFLLFEREALLMCVQCLAYLLAVVSGSGSELKKSAFGAVTQETAEEPIKLPRAVVRALSVDLFFIQLIVVGFLVKMMASPVEGLISQEEIIGSVIMDVGKFGIHAISCFVTIPALALDIWRNGKSF